LSNVEDIEKLRLIFEEERSQDLVMEMGYRKALVTLQISDLESMKGLLRDYYTIVRIKAEVKI